MRTASCRRRSGCCRRIRRPAQLPALPLARPCRLWLQAPRTAPHCPCQLQSHRTAARNCSCLWGNFNTIPVVGWIQAAHAPDIYVNKTGVEPGLPEYIRGCTIDKPLMTPLILPCKHPRINERHAATARGDDPTPPTELPDAPTIAEAGVPAGTNLYSELIPDALTTFANLATSSRIIDRKSTRLHSSH